MAPSNTTTQDTPTNVVTINPRMWAIYNAHINQGLSVKDANAAVPIEYGGPYSGGGGSAAIDRVRKAVAAGATIEVEGAGTVTEGTDAPVDRYAIADDMLPGASQFLLTFDRADADAERHASKALRLRTEADRVEAEAREMHDKVDASRALLTAAGFDWDAFDARVAEASAQSDDEADDDE